MIRMITKLFALACVCVAGAVYAQESHHGHGHDKLHAWYDTLQKNGGGSCCNKKDCRPTRTSIKHLESGALEVHVLIDGEWFKAPPEKILDQPSIDLQSHVCAPKAGTHKSVMGTYTIEKGSMYCVILGQGS